MADESLLSNQAVKIAIQVNGKMRAIIEVPAETSEEEIKTVVLSNPVVAKWVGGHEIKKIIYVQGRAMNIILE